ncbi:MAG TPA: hypothetical protein VM452_18800, partial [Caulifigura sp.]|nr:hypothetical protein [Caulifigura sp.]
AIRAPMHFCSHPAERSRTSRLTTAVASTLLVVAAFVVRPAHGDVITFQSGQQIDGRALPVHGLELQHRAARHRQAGVGTLPEPWWMIDDGVRRYFTPARITQVEERQDLARVPEFTLPPSPKRGNKAIDVIGSVTATPWDEFGRRTVTLKTSRGDVPILQEIVRVRPDYVEVRGVTHEWTMGVDTRLIPDDVLRALLHRGSRPGNLDDRKAIIQFYLDARRFTEAERELQELMESNPDLKSWGEPQLQLIAEQKFRVAVNIVQQRRKAGQHELAYRAATEAMTAPVPADSLLQCQEILSEYNTAREQAGQIQMLLEQFEAELPEEKAAPLRPLRPQLLRELHMESLPRLEPFLRSIADKGLTPEQKLAMAYSAWVVGPSFADTNLDVAVNLWNARFLALEYIRAGDNPLRRDEYVGELRKLEGVTVERLAELVPLLPYVFEPQPPAPGEPRTYTLTLEDGLPVQYAVSLPLEYNPAHRYPAIVALRRSGASLDATLKWWAGSSDAPGMAMTRGYIVIAPEFADAAADSYDYDVAAHRRVMAALVDARQKFAIDSDRVFIGGHQIGGDATFDLAIAHPDVFAGAAPFVGMMDRYPRFAVSNGSQFPWYIVTGERHLPGGLADVDALGRSLGSINRMALTHRSDVTYVEYRARGFESFHEELPRLFDWMDAQRRKSLREVRDGWEVKVLRPTDKRFYWVTAKELPDKLAAPINWASPKGPAPQAMSFSGKIGSENTMHVSVPAGRASAPAEILLSPTFFDFEKRLRVHLNRQRATQINSLIEPDPAVLLEDFRVRGDRQQLFWARVEL